MAKLFVMLVLCVCAFFLTFVAEAWSAECGKHDKVVAFLSSKYKEQRTSMGIVSNRGVMEFFVSDSTGTWTILLTNTQGISCIVASGENYELAKNLVIEGSRL